MISSFHFHIFYLLDPTGVEAGSFHFQLSSWYSESDSPTHLIKLHLTISHLHNTLYNIYILNQDRKRCFTTVVYLSLSFLQSKLALIQPYVADWAQSTKYLANCNQKCMLTGDWNNTEQWQQSFWIWKEDEWNWKEWKIQDNSLTNMWSSTWLLKECTQVYIQIKK